VARRVYTNPDGSVGAEALAEREAGAAATGQKRNVDERLADSLIREVHENGYAIIPELVSRAAASQNIREFGRCSCNALESPSPTHTPHRADRAFKLRFRSRTVHGGYGRSSPRGRESPSSRPRSALD